MTPALTVRLSPRGHDIVRLYATGLKTSINQTVLQALREYLLAHQDELFQALPQLNDEFRRAFAHEVATNLSSEPQS